MSLPLSKLKLLHVARRQLGIEEEAWRAILRQHGGVASSRELSQGGFDGVMLRLGQLGFKSTSPLKPLPRRRGMSPPGQAQLIRHLWAEFTDGKGTDASLGKWLEGRFKVSALRFVDEELAPKAIGALRNMVARKAARPAQAPPSAA